MHTLFPFPVLHGGADTKCRESERSGQMRFIFTLAFVAGKQQTEAKLRQMGSPEDAEDFWNDFMKILSTREILRYQTLLDSLHSWFRPFSFQNTP